MASGQLRTVTNPLARCPSVLDAALHPGFFPKISDIFRGRARLLSNEYFVTPPRSKPRLTWHRDADERNYAGIDLADSLVTLNALVLLSDVGPDNGPTLAIPGSHRWPEHRSVSTHLAGRRRRPLCAPGSRCALRPRRDGRVLQLAPLSLAIPERERQRATCARVRLRAPLDARVRRLRPGRRQAESLADSPLTRQLLGLGPAFDAPSAPYEVPRRWSGDAPSG